MADLRRLQPLQTALRDSGSFSEDGLYSLLVCPVCSFPFNHIGDPLRRPGDDDYQAWQGRGDLVVIPMTGECRSEWDICFGFHKGESYSFVPVRRACTDKSYLYFIEAVGTEYIKIGRSADPDRRLAQLSTGSPTELKIIGRLGGGAEVEKELHAQFDHLRERGEWFKATPELTAFLTRSTV